MDKSIANIRKQLANYAGGVPLLAAAAAELQAMPDTQLKAVLVVLSDLSDDIANLGLIGALEVALRAEHLRQRRAA